MVRTHTLHAPLLLLLCSVAASHQSLALNVRSYPSSTTDSKTPVALSLARNVNATGSRNVLKLDQARAQAFRARARGPNQIPSNAAAFNDEATGRVVTYTVNVAVGNPPTSYNLLIDTGSSNTWVGAASLDLFHPSCQPTNDIVAVSYGSGSFIGLEKLCEVTLVEGLTIPEQSVGVAAISKGFNGVDGILGIGPVDLTQGTLVLESEKEVPTVTDNAQKLGLLTEYIVGISFEPLNQDNETNGELTFGGVNHSKFNGTLNYAPLTKVSPASKYVGIDQKITYGEGQPVMPSGSGILDTGTTLILLATDAFDKYKNYTGAQLDNDTGLLRITPEQYANLKSLQFTIGGVSYELTQNAQIWPRTLNAAMGGDPEGIYLIVNDLGQISGSGLDFINGMGFLERFYMVYDVGNSRAGLATTPFTYATTN
ncbi:aspartic peptidase A1 [Dichomitus squalens LYAD-421 SS1]|uniref:Aspartic peptidase A1 n=2 Tax=Dichomitus squalens TaxID=114155 RepID=A0A4Q9MR73_9APHY|nr:aspartic peptidase A1 [Dichomitus squalens LYAD-421 SS1]EJF59840.1 aspartic peptidase A1 [Dichomitus squalens LYAD-421 SS1]TBU30340.1 aspartic peptidase A1 [Dichomitus squalens]